MHRLNRLIGGVLLVSGTTIGAGMLALPVSTGLMGFVPSCLLFLIYWVYMTTTAFLMLEVNLWSESNLSLISMARLTLGKWGAAVNWVIYLFLLYALTTAYIAVGGPIFLEILQMALPLALPTWTGVIPLLCIFGFFVYRGTKSVDYINRFLMLGLAVTYVLMVFFLTPHVNPALLTHQDWNFLPIAVSVVATSFGFHIIIPTLTVYLERDAALMRKTIAIGSLIPLVIYIIWEYLTLGIIPLHGANGIAHGYEQGANGADLLALALQNASLALIARLFSFCAIVTSFLGVSLCLFDFLADGFGIQKNAKGKLWIYVIAFLPPLILTLTDPRAFLTALEYAGAFGVMTLLGLMPALMVWRGRYRLQFESTFKVPGGKLLLIGVILFSVTIMGIEVANKLGMFKHLISSVDY